MILAGRGWGKSKTGAEWIRAKAESGRSRHLALVAPTAADARDVMVEGVSGVLACCPPGTVDYEPSKRKLSWKNGCVAHTYSADEPDRLRGPNHDGAWCDELSVWKRGQEAWDMLQFGLRLGEHPQSLVTMTPRPTALVRALVKDPKSVITRGAMYDNAVNLAESFIAKIRAKYEGTRLGRQEIFAEILDDTPGALWSRTMIDAARVSGHPDLISIVVAIDPATTAGEDSDETGIVVTGLGVDEHGYVLDDLSCRMSPEGWARRAIGAYYRYNADCIVAESNQGGEMVRSVLANVGAAARQELAKQVGADDAAWQLPIKIKLVHASRGKRTRAEPIALLYEQGLVHHVGDWRNFDVLEEQMCNFVPGIVGSVEITESGGSRRKMQRSPDHVDALVWGLTELFLEEQEALVVGFRSPMRISPY